MTPVAVGASWLFIIIIIIIILHFILLEKLVFINTAVPQLYEPCLQPFTVLQPCCSLGR